MRKRTKEKKVKAVPVGIGILVFILAFIGGVVSKLAIAPSWAKEYSVQWSDEIGTLKTDIPYGDGEANKFDLSAGGQRERKVWSCGLSPCRRFYIRR